MVVLNCVKAFITWLLHLMASDVSIIVFLFKQEKRDEP
jgi:hypothetical protein